MKAKKLLQGMADGGSEDDCVDLDGRDSGPDLFDSFELGGIVQGWQPETSKNAIVSLNHANLMQIISCASHTLHLIVMDALEEEQWTNILPKIRKLVKLLRTPRYLSYQRENGLKRPVLNVKTRWNSICCMVRLILPLKPFSIQPKASSIIHSSYLISINSIHYFSWSLCCHIKPMQLTLKSSERMQISHASCGIQLSIYDWC